MKEYNNVTVWITQAEIDTIKSLRSKPTERLAFTILCLAKRDNIIRPNNNNTFLFDGIRRTYKNADLQKYSKREDCFRAISYCGLANYNDIDHRGVVYFIDDNPPRVWKVDRFDQLGREYRLLCGENYVRCQKCGAIVKNNLTHTRKYCDNCNGTIPQETKYCTCRDCKKRYKTSSKDNKSTRCPECQQLIDKYMNKERQRRYREGGQAALMNFPL